MSRQKTEINPIRAERVKKLIELEKISQTEFAKEIHQTQQNVSRIINLKTALTEENAREIVKHFPEYRIEWLLGYDDYMTDYDWADGIEYTQDRVAECMWGILEKSLNKQGKSLKFVHRQGQHVDSRQRVRADCYYSVVDKDGQELKRLTAIEMIEIEQKLQEYSDFISERYL